MDEPERTLTLWDHRRRVAEHYRRVREAGGGAAAWQEWRRARDELFGAHPQSALDADARATFSGLPYFDHDPAWRLVARFEPTEEASFEIAHSGAGTTTFRRVATARFEGPDGAGELAVYWLDAYGGGVFVPFRDATAGDETYGGGRYLLDTVKGADLGRAGDDVVFDFNFSYHPSCVHSPVWSCPLAPPENVLPFPVRAGERLA